MKLTTSCRKVCCLLAPLFILSQDHVQGHSNQDTRSQTRRTLSLFIISFIISFLPFGTTHAQQREAIKGPGKAIDLTATGIQIGQQVPDISLTNIHNYKSASAQISDFRGKLLILDFWATWCSPCVAMIPRMDSLQKEFGDKVQFISVTYQKENEVLPFLEKFEKQQGRHFSLPNIVADTVLHKLFLHVYLPHYVWIDGNGIVKAITEYKDINAENILKALSGRIALRQKIDYSIPYEMSAPFLLNGNGGNGNNLIYHSALTPYTKGMISFMTTKPVKHNQVRVTCGNNSILQLFETAWSEKGNFFYSNYELSVLNVKDKHKIHSDAVGEDYLQWLADGNGYCYELLLPSSLKDSIHLIMKADLARFFPQYKAEIKTFPDSVWIIKALTAQGTDVKAEGKPLIEADRFGQHVKNVTVAKWAARLNNTQSTPKRLIDETGWARPVSFDLAASPGDFEGTKQELEKHGLSLIRGTRPVKKLVISDK